ncbi:hypothetical protein KC717_06480 [Candidatus Dojkabacteria bacterium]|uniref:Uncharacterized protein n=1 Tax=Candidatus Dojkabacteria bacterium TaxID=2099670 RepID=A0A955RLE0_9BACT|nr:hypothetical protein [Candidatus Dojkabacteria bacterium]
MSKLEKQQIEALNKINQLRDLKEDVELNGIHNPYGVQLLEMNEDALRNILDKELKAAAIRVIEERIANQKKLTDFLLGGENDNE